MKDFEVIDAHAHLVRNPDEELHYWVNRFPGRRERDRFGTPGSRIAT
ncbi:MAG: hypothetical protein HYY32_06870 [Chloroflexi bacterium]|nr:hypothetical protein [Chloroflexota bacterium]